MINLFDLVEDRLIFRCEICEWCDLHLRPDRTSEIVMQAYQGQHGHLVIIGYHKICLLNRLKMFKEWGGQ
jgi:hypothetical protein